MNNSTSTSTPIASASSNPSTSTSSTDQKVSTPVGQTSVADDARSTGSGNSTPQSVGGDQPVGTKSKEVVKENKDVTAR